MIYPFSRQSIRSCIYYLGANTVFCVAFGGVPEGHNGVFRVAVLRCGWYPIPRRDKTRLQIPNRSILPA